MIKCGFYFLGYRELIMNFKVRERCDLIYILDSLLFEVWGIYYSRIELEVRIVGGCWVNLSRKWLIWRKRYRKYIFLIFNILVLFCNLGGCFCKSVNNLVLFLG